MADSYGDVMTKVANSSPLVQPEANEVLGRVRIFSESVTLASQPNADQIAVARIPAGATIHEVQIYSDQDLSLHALDLGYNSAEVSGSTGDEILNGVTGPNATTVSHPVTVDTPKPTDINSTNEATKGARNVWIGSDTDMPASGTLRVKIFFSFD